MYAKEVKTSGGGIHFLIAEGHGEAFLNLSISEQIEINQFVSKKRRLEYAQIRSLKEKCFPGTSIGYFDSGKPFLKGRKEIIGISHSNNIGLFGYSVIPFGCDLEVKSNRFIQLFPRYTTEGESVLLSNLSLSDRYCVLWVCKEAIYKFLNQTGVLWRDECVLRHVNMPILKFELLAKNICTVVTCYVEEFQEKAWIAFAY